MFNCFYLSSIIWWNVTFCTKCWKLCLLFYLARINYSQRTTLRSFIAFVYKSFVHITPLFSIQWRQAIPWTLGHCWKLEKFVPTLSFIWVGLNLEFTLGALPSYLNPLYHYSKPTQDLLLIFIHAQDNQGEMFDNHGIANCGVWDLDAIEKIFLTKAFIWRLESSWKGFGGKEDLRLGQQIQPMHLQVQSLLHAAFFKNISHDLLVVEITFSNLLFLFHDIWYREVFNLLFNLFNWSQGDFRNLSHSPNTGFHLNWA